MNDELIVIFFTLLIVGFIVSNYFFSFNKEYVKIRKINDFFVLSFVLSLLLWSLLCASIFFESKNLIILFCSLLSVVLIKEALVSLIKIYHFNKQYKVILKENNYTINSKSIKKQFEIEALKNLFYVLAAPLLSVQYLLTLLLNKIY